MREEIRRAREHAIGESLKQVRDGMVIGLGSGSTVELFVGKLRIFLEENSMEVEVIPSSYQSYLLALRNGLKIASLDENPRPDLTIDSFDQVDRRGSAIKGGGGALTREKILCHAAKRTILIGDYAKLTESLSMPIPVEVIPFALGYVVDEVTRLGGEPKIREGSGKVGPVITDNGNLLVDVKFEEIRNPAELERTLDSIPGIVENGLFTSNITEVLIGHPDGKVLRITPSTP